MMRYPDSEAPGAPHEFSRAAILIDYDNLYQALTRRLDRSSDPDAYVTDAVAELERYLLDGGGTSTVLTRAYADFATLEREAATHIERDLYQRGIEPCYVPTSMQSTASEMHLAVDAVDLLHRRGDIQTFVLVTGDRTYLPLVQTLRRYGRRALVAALEAPQSSGTADTIADQVYLDLLNLLDEPARRALISRGQPSSSPRSDAAVSTVGEPEGFEELPQAVLYRTLEITEQHFGQYDEVYLTPLLRKLSEMLGSDYDPKSLISDLEAAGAVRLEKRDGYPYDYTVLIVHDNHPDVQAVRHAVDRSVDVRRVFEEDDFFDDYDEDAYDDEDDYSASSYFDDYARLDGDGHAEDDDYDSYDDERDDEMSEEER